MQCSLIYDRTTTGFSQVHCTSEEKVGSGLTDTTLFNPYPANVENMMSS